MIACDAGRALAMASLAGALLLGQVSLVQIVVAAFLEGSLNVAFRPAETGALKQLVPPRDLSTAIAANEARDNAAYLAGPSLGGVFFALTSAAPFLADAASYVISLVALLRIRQPFQQKREAQSRPLHREIVEGLFWVRRQPFLRAALLLAGGSNLVSNALALLVIIVARQRGASPTTVGLMLTLVAVGGLAGAVATPTLRRHVPTRLLILGVPWLYAALIPTLALVPDALPLGAIFGVMTFLGPAWNAVVGGFAIMITPDHLQSRCSSIDSLLSGAGIAIAPLAAGFLLSAFSATAAIAALAALALVVALGGSASRALREPPAPGEATA